MPFEFQSYRSPFANSIAETILRRGDIAARQAESVGAIQANAAQQSGQGWAHALMGASNAVAAIPGQIQQQEVAQQESELRGLQLTGARRAQADFDALDKAYATGSDRDSVLNALPGHLRPTVAKSFADADKASLEVQALKDKTAVAERDYFGSLAAGVKPFLDSEDGGVGAAMVALQHAKEKGYKDADRLWQQIKSNPEALPQMIEQLVQASPKQVELLRASATQAETVRHNTQTETQAATTATATADRAAVTAAETARHNKEAERIGRMTAGRAEAAQAETARHNRAMEENARNAKTGRPIIAGDAEDMANFDTSRDELKVLQEAITAKGDTGIMASIAAKTPYVTQITGWGADAKAKQALIDRVKQVIGKSLEGGVLRKEDEAKYEKILPTIGDPNEVVIAKITGLDAALDQRKGRRLDALQDAGYDVSRFRARQAEKPLDPLASAKKKLGIQ